MKLYPADRYTIEMSPFIEFHDPSANPILHILFYLPFRTRTRINLNMNNPILSFIHGNSSIRFDCISKLNESQMSCRLVPSILSSLHVLYPSLPFSLPPQLSPFPSLLLNLD